MSSQLALDQVRARATRALAAHRPGAGVGKLTPLPGGISSLTFSATARAAGDPSDVRVVVKVAPPGLAPVRNRDVLRQARILRGLDGLPGVAVPSVLGEDDGTPPLFVMSHVPGHAHEPRWDSAAEAPDAAAIGARVIAAATMLAHLHLPAPQSLGHGVATERPALGPREELERWGTLYATAGDELRGDERRLHEALLARVPESVPPRVTHGDYRLGNLLVSGARVQAIIDWELWALGDPRTDLAWLIMFCDPAIERRPPAETAPRSAMPSAAEVIAAYELVRPGTAVELEWFLAYAHYKLASTMAVLAKRNRRSPLPDPTLERAAQTLPDAIRRGLEVLEA